MRDVNEDANAVIPRFHRRDAVEEPVFVIPQRYVSPQKKSTFKKRTPKPAAPLPKRFKDDEPVNVTWDCVVPVASTTDEEGGKTVNLNVSNPKPLSPIIEESECGTLLWDPNPGVVVEKARVPSKAVEAVEHSYASPVVDIGGRDLPIVDDPNITVPVPGRSLKEISSELTIRGRYEEEAIVRCTSSAVDRYRREASTIEDYDRSMYILYHRSMSRREMRDLVPADFKPKASPNYKITPDECMPSSTRSNKDKHLLFSEDPAHLERTIRKDQHSTSLDAVAFTSINSHTQQSTDTRPSSSTDLHRSTSVDTTPSTSIDHQSRNMVAIVILRQNENGNLYDQDGHLRNTIVVKHEKLGEGDFEVESSMSFGRSQWCRQMSMDAHRSTNYDEDRSTNYSNHRSTSSAESTVDCSAVRIMTHEELAEKHPHPPSPFYVKIDRRHEPAVDRQRETDIDRSPSPPIDRRAPLTYLV
ncbi:hypothetical protein F2Q69_00005253 [Brassica cretica]|uniref:Uncharacterized protein n=1 Tax=Brassica cretica TaxID=69181 RepID=A0A8S9NUU4_BRACR|nr:hypothetical protein F2Q69_00005253 [Brassica cretica]